MKLNDSGVGGDKMFAACQTRLMHVVSPMTRSQMAVEYVASVATSWVQMTSIDAMVAWSRGSRDRFAASLMMKKNFRGKSCPCSSFWRRVEFPFFHAQKEAKQDVSGRGNAGCCRSSTRYAGSGTSTTHEIEFVGQRVYIFAVIFDDRCE
jgi:hypothetical protein